MSDGQFNEMTRSLLRSQSAKELEKQLLQLRKGELSQLKRKAQRLTRGPLTQKELELPTIHDQPPSALCKTTGVGNYEETSSSAQSKFESMHVSIL